MCGTGIIAPIVLLNVVDKKFATYLKYRNKRHVWNSCSNIGMSFDRSIMQRCFDYLMSLQFTRASILKGSLIVQAQRSARADFYGETVAIALISIFQTGHTRALKNVKVSR